MEILILRQIPLLIFFCYSILTLNTAYYFKGSIVKNRKKITNNYFETEFKLDFFIISGLLVSYFTGQNYLKLVFLLQLIKLKKLE